MRPTGRLEDGHDGAVAAGLAGADHDQLVHAGLGPPHLAGPAQELAHVGRRARQGDDCEALGGEVEPTSALAAKSLSQGWSLSSTYGIGHRVRPGQLPLAPAAVGRVVAPELAGVPPAHPDPAARVGPDPAGAGYAEALLGWGSSGVDGG